MTALALAALMSLNLNLSPKAAAQQQPAVPDAPAPQAPKPLSDIGPITPGIGANEQPASTATGDSPSQPDGAANQPPPDVKDNFQQPAPQIADVEAMNTIIHMNVTYVEVPVTVKDAKGKLVAGLTWRDFKVYENNTREPIKVFNVDPYPLSIAFVIDQSLTSDVMRKVNDSLNAIQGALTPYDEVAIFSYANGPQERTGFTGAQSARLPAVLALAKAAGTDELVPIGGGPFTSCNIRQNGNCADPNLQEGRSTGSTTGQITIPKEIHTLNDAILAAAKELATRPKGRRRVIYVISDGHEYGSKATVKEVIRYLETNEISVYGTLVGTSAAWG